MDRGAWLIQRRPVRSRELIFRVAADLAGIVSELVEDIHPWRREQFASSIDLALPRLNVDVSRELAPEWPDHEKADYSRGSCHWAAASAATPASHRTVTNPRSCRRELPTAATVGFLEAQFNAPVPPRERAACSDACDWLSAVRRIDPWIAA